MTPAKRALIALAAFSGTFLALTIINAKPAHHYQSKPLVVFSFVLMAAALVAALFVHARQRKN